MDIKFIKKLFIVSAAYDFIIGLIFLVAFKHLYNHFGVALPNHDGYIQFAAIVVMAFGVGFWFVAQDPVRNRDIIKMGIILKIAYSGVVLGHDFFGYVPSVWVPWAYIDLVFLILFIMAHKALPKS